MIDIVTMKFGTKYGPEYANRLYRGVERNLGQPHRFWCFTDDPAGLDSGIYAETAGDLGGWWNHLWAFSGWTVNRQMLIDIDDVIVGSLDEMAAYEGPHAINSDVYQPQNVDGGFQLIPCPPHRGLFDEFMANMEEIRNRYHSDKEFYVARINAAARVERLFPGQWVSLKVNCAAGIPENARIIGCHGLPKPSDLPADHEVRKIWESEEVAHASR